MFGRLILSVCFPLSQDKKLTESSKKKSKVSSKQTSTTSEAKKVKIYFSDLTISDQAKTSCFSFLFQSKKLKTAPVVETQDISSSETSSEEQLLRNRVRSDLEKKKTLGMASNLLTETRPAEPVIQHVPTSTAGPQDMLEEDAENVEGGNDSERTMSEEGDVEEASEQLSQSPPENPIVTSGAQQVTTLASTVEVERRPTMIPSPIPPSLVNISSSSQIVQVEVPVVTNTPPVSLASLSIKEALAAILTKRAGSTPSDLSSHSASVSISSRISKVAEELRNLVNQQSIDHITSNEGLVKKIKKLLEELEKDNALSKYPDLREFKLIFEDMLTIGGDLVSTESNISQLNNDMVDVVNLLSSKSEVIDEKEKKLAEGQELLASLDAEIARLQKLREDQLIKNNAFEQEKSDVEMECKLGIERYSQLDQKIQEGEGRIANMKSRMDELRKRHADLFCKS